MLIVGFRLQRMGDAADDDFGGRGTHRAGRGNAMPQPFNEQPSVGIEHDLDDRCVVECDAELVAEGVLEFAHKTGVRTELGHAALLNGPAPSRSMIER
ncbi:hypothetical protein D3C87_1739310 [compost metagenome]